MPDPRSHQRFSLRLEEYDYSFVGAYFVTICTWGRKCLFGEIADSIMGLNETGQIVQSNWEDLPNRFPSIEIDEFVVMPNHIHGIIVISGAHGSIHKMSVRAIHESLVEKSTAYDNKTKRRNMLLPKVIGYFKMNTAKKINQLRNTPGIPVWQRNYYDHIIRNERSLTAIQQYIQNNPAMWPQDLDNPNVGPIRAVVGAIHELPLQHERENPIEK